MQVCIEVLLVPGSPFIIIWLTEFGSKFSRFWLDVMSLSATTDESSE